MKCVLIIPAWLPEQIFPSKTVSSQINYWQPLGTLYVAAAMLRASHEVEYLNGAFMSHEAIMARVAELRPRFAGLYATTFGFPKAVRTADALKAQDPDLFVCVGGPYPMAEKGACLEGDGGSFDAVITGEAEVAIVELIERLSSGQGLEGLAGVDFRRGPEIVRNPPAPLIEDLDSLPFPARHLLGEKAFYIPAPGQYRRKPVTTLITSRGCNRRCIFCFQADRNRQSGNRGIRFRSVGNVLEEIELCLAQGYREIKFLDDSFAADDERAMAICSEIKRRKLDFTWFASASINQVDKPLLRAMKDAGCWAILFGADSGVQKTLNSLKKGTTLEMIRRDVGWAKEVGLRVNTPFIFGAPGETFEDGLKTIDFAVELDADFANFHALTPFPGTPLYEDRDKYGRVSADLSDRTYQSAAFVPYTMTRDQILKLRQIAFRRFYSRPRFMLRRLLQMRSWQDLQANLIGLRSLSGLWSAKNPFQGWKGKAGTVQYGEERGENG